MGLVDNERVIRGRGDGVVKDPRVVLSASPGPAAGGRRFVVGVTKNDDIVVDFLVEVRLLDDTEGGDVVLPYRVVALGGVVVLLALAEPSASLP